MTLRIGKVAKAVAATGHANANPTDRAARQAEQDAYAKLTTRQRDAYGRRIANKH